MRLKCVRSENNGEANLAVVPWSKFSDKLPKTMVKVTIDSLERHMYLLIAKHNPTLKPKNQVPNTGSDQCMLTG
jgi:hypothetical protein